MVQWLLFIVFSVYFILDAYHTSLLLQVGLGEANPLMDKVINFYPDNPLIPLLSIKIFLVAILGILLLINNIRRKRI